MNTFSADIGCNLGQPQMGIKCQWHDKLFTCAALVNVNLPYQALFAKTFDVALLWGQCHFPYIMPSLLTGRVVHASSSTLEASEVWPT